MTELRISNLHSTLQILPLIFYQESYDTIYLDNADDLCLLIANIMIIEIHFVRNVKILVFYCCPRYHV